ncbi:hypothetical protein M406DRAFT_358120 [Cryphonectria parasitica EP155]|uniref:Uncharacterized protein n=1 Tax=Cryphonectria parasitica (strain ATCC 38755 / EP155) TaxID=660469 RepID=A0A9P5CK35_CRYP1|nr:uncharacterized protein M406DRAFT_358120 [Cryphonectria parasitica EP155]KAF3761869.1 hypothetical protein M406DRAFT_358120 [Cryphonectria parasitica EP155]
MSWGYEVDDAVRVRRKREVLRRGAARVGQMGVLAASVGSGVDAHVLNISCGLALRTVIAAFWIVSTVLEKFAMWFVIRAYGVAVWTMKTLLLILN